MAKTPKQRGPSAERVAANVRELRKARGLDLAGLAQRMSAVGQPIGLTGISKLETGERRVDVDDLVALAVALDVSPVRLLLPPTADETKVDVTPDAEATARTAWLWATGEKPLPNDLWREQSVDVDLDRDLRFETENRPHDPPDTWTFDKTMQHEDVLSPIARAASAAADAGVPVATIFSYLRMWRSLRPIALAARSAKPKKAKG